MVCFYRCVNIIVEKIFGYVKGYDYNLDIWFELGYVIIYMWNVVYVDGEWCFVDCMWGVGNCDEMKKFYFDYYDYFYFMDLDYFILIYFFYECDINMVIVW